MKKILYTFLLAVVSLTAQAQTDETQTVQATDSIVIDSTATAPVPPVLGVMHFVSNLDLDLSMGGDTYSLGGNVYALWNEVVRIQLTFMGFMEVATLEFTQEYVLIINRMQHEYTKMRYDEVEMLRRNGVTFQAAQELTWSKIYAEKKQEITDTSLDQMVENLLGGGKAKVKIAIGKPNTKKEFTVHVTPSSRYTEVSPAELLSKLTKVSF